MGENVMRLAALITAIALAGSSVHAADAPVFGQMPRRFKGEPDFQQHVQAKREKDAARGIENW